MGSKPGIVKMRPRAQLISVIGNELISDELVAVAELVKNAYDADASEVQVTFKGLPGDYESIVVTDDGIGMDLGTVTGSWLEPGTSLKRNTLISLNGRTYQGAKGIGRFAAARLAHKLLMETKQIGSREGISVLLDWDKFDEESYLDEIKLEYEYIKLTEMKHGTRLTLKGLRTSWVRKDFVRLYARLARLLSPFDEIKDFKIKLEIPGESDLSGEITTPEMIEEPLYSFAGKLDAAGNCKGIITIEGQQIPLKTKLGKGKERPECGGFDFEIRSWDRDLPGLLTVQERFDMSAKEIRETLNTYSGVSIYRDGFRVYPYGERGNDWLNLDLRSRQVPAKNLANNQIIAAIRISRKTNPELEDRSNREGLIKNPAYDSLTTWFIEVLKQLEIARDRHKRKEEEEEVVEEGDDDDEEEDDDTGEEPKTGGFREVLDSLDITDAVKEVEQELGKKHKVSKLIAVTSDRVKEGVDRVQETFSKLIVLAGLGQLIDILLHEIGSPLGKLSKQLKLMEKDIATRYGPEESKYFQKDFASLNRWLENIAAMRNQLDPQAPTKRGKVSSFDVVEAVSDFIKLYRTVLTKEKIDLELNAPESLMVKMPRSVLDQILANLVDNAIYWVGREHGNDGGHILVRVNKLKHGFSVQVSDNGPGVEKADIKRIFEAYVSNKPEGIGLGLYIASLMIDPYGSLAYKSNCELGGACFEAVFNDRVGL